MLPHIMVLYVASHHTFAYLCVCVVHNRTGCLFLSSLRLTIQFILQTQSAWEANHLDNWRNPLASVWPADNWILLENKFNNENDKTFLFYLIIMNNNWIPILFFNFFPLIFSRFLQTPTSITTGVGGRQRVVQSAFVTLWIVPSLLLYIWRKKEQNNANPPNATEDATRKWEKDKLTDTEKFCDGVKTRKRWVWSNKRKNKARNQRFWLELEKKWFENKWGKKENHCF